MRLSLATRIFLGQAAVLITFGAVSLFSVAEMHRNQVEIRLVSEGYLHLSQTAAAVETFHKNQSRDIARLHDEKSVETRRAMIRLARQYFPPIMAEKLAEGRAKAHEVLEFTPKSELSFVRDVGQKFEELEGRYTEYAEASDAAFRILESSTPDWTAAESRLDRVTQLDNSIGATIRLLHASLEARILERVASAQERERRTGIAIIALSVLAIAVGFLATGLAARWLRPVGTLTEGVSRVARGDYTAQLGIKGDDEIAILAREFDAMAQSLREREAQLQQKQEELLRSERLAAMGRMSAQISHEVRNPLSSIGLNTEMLEEQLGRATFATPADAKETRDLLAAVSREVDRLTEITEDYLRLARLPNPTLKPEDLNQVVDGVLSFSREELERAHVDVRRELAEQPVIANADEGQLRQVLLNLVRNGREAMAGAGGRLTLGTRVINGEVEVTVADTGPGLSAEAREHLFEPFFSTKPGGTGLGLSLSQQIVQAHGGRLEVGPAGAREGTCFVLRFPKVAA